MKSGENLRALLLMLESSYHHIFIFLLIQQLLYITILGFLFQLFFPISYYQHLPAQ